MEERPGGHSVGKARHPIALGPHRPGANRSSSENQSDTKTAWVA